ncbi:hypothetical protein BAOM_3147 [Peribacillus asahii]|uniref:Right handed beta helix domain-containing protein n=1 Tax=Peribacillus asahii TaxID=228899 RepID=A0A3Q9RPA2_9BACI|nr:right-handed parallel beta-helix repeat-containing protein [Peribacillus asahii]AZV43756.1 hypothetical protein BAOM_3147 [Peribacillus asahii]
MLNRIDKNMIDKDFVKKVDDTAAILVEASNEIGVLTQNTEEITTQLAETTQDIDIFSGITGIKVENFKRLAGETDDTGRVQRAIDSIPAPQVKATLIFAENQYDIGTSVNLPNIPIKLVTFVGTVINATTTNPSFLRTHHKKLEVEGFTFKGAGNGIKFNMALSAAMNFDFHIKTCAFEMNSGVYGLYFYGAREGTIEKCTFKSGNGIYRQDTVNTLVDMCIFLEGLGIGVMDDGSVGANAAYSCGLYLHKCLMLGVTEGVVIQYTDHFTIDGCMIDYCDKPLQIYGQDGGVICGGTYISSRTVNPSIRIAKGASSTDRPRNIKITDSFILGHSTSPFSCIYISDGTDIDIKADITFYSEYGVKYENTVKLKINLSNISPRSGYGTNSIKCLAGDDSTNITTFSTLDQPTSTQYMRYRDCLGHASRRTGTATIAAGSTEVTVTHGANSIPTINNVTVMPTNNLGSALKYWVDPLSVTASTFKIYVDQNPLGSGATFKWEVNI